MKKAFMVYAPRSIIKTPNDVMGWVYDDFTGELILELENNNDIKFFKYKERKAKWGKENWQTIKVKITIEIGD